MAFQEEFSLLSQLADDVEPYEMWVSFIHVSLTSPLTIQSMCRACEQYHETKQCPMVLAKYICYHCGQKGHLRSMCTNLKAKKCARCMLIGHNFNDCCTAYRNPCRNCGRHGHTRVNCGNDSRCLPKLVPWKKSKQALRNEQL